MRISDWSSDVCSSDLSANESSTLGIGQCLHYRIDRRFMRLGAAWHENRFLGVYRVADGGEFAQHRARIAVLEQRPMVSSPDALPKSVRGGVEPHLHSRGQTEGACRRVHDTDSDGGEHLRFTVV